MTRIAVSASPSDHEVQITRGERVPDDFWLEVRAIWGSSGDSPGSIVVAPLGLFLLRRSDLAAICRRYAVAIDWTPEALEVVRAIAAEQDRLEAILAGSEELTDAELSERLQGTRLREDRELRDFQRAGLRRLLALPHGADFSVPGAGKTFVALALYEAERTAGRIRRALIVGPYSAFDAWSTEAARSLDPMPVINRYEAGVPDETEILLATYQRLQVSFDELADWVSEEATLVILDEAHRMKRGWEGEWGSKALRLAYLAARRGILTGTPAPQSSGDLRSLLEYLWPTQAARLVPSAAIAGGSSGARQINAIVKPLFARTTKVDLDLPGVSFDPRELRMGELQAAIYESLRDNYGGELQLSRQSRLDFARMGRVVMYLLEAATNPALLKLGSSRDDFPSFSHPSLPIPPGSDLSDLLDDYLDHETPIKVLEVLSIVKENSDDGLKTLVWSNFVANLLMLAETLEIYEPALIHGGVPTSPQGEPLPETREGELQRFKEEEACTVLLANPAALSEGANLHDACHHAVFVDRTFNAGQYLQALDRIHRLGIPPGTVTTITLLMSAGTVDGTVDVRIREKARRMGELLNDPGIVALALPDDDDYGAVIDSELDTAALFGHLLGED